MCVFVETRERESRSRIKSTFAKRAILSAVKPGETNIKNSVSSIPTEILYTTQNTQIGIDRISE